MFDLKAIEDQLARNPTRPGAKPSAGPRHPLHRQDATANETEEALLAITRPAWHTRSGCNAFVDPDDGGPPHQRGFVWREERVVIEADSPSSAHAPQPFESDRHEDQRLIPAGWKIIRTTWRQMTRAAA